MEKKDKNNKVINGLKHSFKKLKYLDKTKTNYFIVTTFIAAFCTFAGVTYSYFTYSKSLNAANITIAKLNYNLSSTNEDYQNGSIVVPTGETVYLDFQLKSLNTEKTRYALNYTTNSEDIDVYYSENLKKNVSGIIGARGSVIDMRIVVVNNSKSDETVKFSIKGGYLQNKISSNVTQGYFEQDLTIRTVVYDEYFENPTEIISYPEKEQYAFYKVECSNGVTANFDINTWSLNRSDEEKQTSCDVYFKKSTDELEIYYSILGNNSSTIITKNKPDTNGLYRYKDTICTTGTTYNFNEQTYEFNINSYSPNTVCVANFETDITLENSDKYYVYFDANGGKTKIYSKVVIKDATYGFLPVPVLNGYIFEGWFTDKTDGTKITSSDIVKLTKDVTLYAKWQEATQVDVTLARLNAIKDENVLEILDDYGTSYYYPSDSQDNYIKYAGLYFRILRVNGDGTLRIMYYGKNVSLEESADSYIAKTVWNTDYNNDAKYVGYVYGGENGVSSTSKAMALENTTDANIKTVLEDWYKTNIYDKGYDIGTGDAIFCNDRSTEDDGFGYNPSVFASYKSLFDEEGVINNSVLDLSCSNVTDAFTVKDTVKGNGALYYPVGLISAKEAVLIGLDEESYLHRDEAYWTMSPSRYTDGAYVFLVGDTLLEQSVNEEAQVIPVININIDYASMIEGDGTIDNPFMIR